MKWITFALVVAGLAQLPMNASAEYVIKDLGAQSYGVSYATDINASGQVTGHYTTSDGYYHAYRYDGSAFVDLGSLPNSDYSYGLGINDHGHVTGYSVVDTYAVAFVHDGQGMTNISSPDETNSTGYAINNSGAIVGDASRIGFHQAFLYENGSKEYLGTLAGSTSYATDINSAGQVVGHSTSDTLYTHAFLFTDGNMVDLGTLPGGRTSFAHGINDAGMVVGASERNRGVYHAFLHDGTTMHDLGKLNNGNNSEAYDINNLGQIVGSAQAGTSRSYSAFIYDGAVMHNLNDMIEPTSGWHLTSAEAINDAGQIVGYGKYAGEDRAFLLTPSSNMVPVPEPASIGMFGLGALGLLIRAQWGRIRSVT